MGMPEGPGDRPPEIAPNGRAADAPPQDERLENGENRAGGSHGDPTLAEACRLLDVRPEVLRRLLEECANDLPPLIENRGERRLSRHALPRLAHLVRSRQGGTPAPAIALAADQSAAATEAPAVAAPAPPSPDAQLLDRFAALLEELRRTEARRAEDRDRLLTALMRTNQELQQLRFEIGRQPRRARRGGWLGRLWR